MSMRPPDKLSDHHEGREARRGDHPEDGPSGPIHARSETRGLDFARILYPKPGMNLIRDDVGPAIQNSLLGRHLQSLTGEEPANG